MVPKHAPCPERQALVDALRRNHAAILVLGQREFDAVMRSDWDADLALNVERKVLQEHREKIVRQLRQHAATHGC